MENLCKKYDEYMITDKIPKSAVINPSIKNTNSSDLNKLDSFKKAHKENIIKVIVKNVQLKHKIERYNKEFTELKSTITMIQANLQIDQ